MGPTVIDRNPETVPNSFLTTGIWTKLQEIADNASLSVEETGSSATESDSIGSLRNSSPENINTVASLTTLAGSCSSKDLKNKGGISLHPGRISSPSPRINRLSPMVTGSATSAKLQKQILSHSASKHQDLGYHTLLNKHVATCSTSSLESSENSGGTLWDVRATKTPIRDLKIMTHNAKHSPISRSSTPKNLSVTFSSNSSEKALSIASATNGRGASFRNLPDSMVLKVLSFLTTNDLVKCSRISRRFYFLSWEPDLWDSVVLDGDQRSDTDLALKTIFRLLSRNPAGRPGLSKLVLNGCARLTDRGLAIVARTCPNLSRLEIQHCVNITSGGLMDLVTKCQMLDHLDVTGCHMISTIKVHQPPPTPNPTTRGATSSTLPLRRLDHLQYLDLTDCLSLEDSGLKMVVETCPQLLYLFLRRCTAITDIGIKYVSSYCLQLRELSISDCSQITDFGLYELAKLGPNLRYLSVAKCDQISDAGVKQIARLCYKLRYLNVRGCEAVSDEAIEMLARSCSRLRSLDLGKCDVTDVGLKMLSENCPNLKKLSVKSCEMVSDRGIQCVAYYCRGLQQLNIQDCPITLEGYRMVKKFCKRCIIEHSHPGFF